MTQVLQVGNWSVKPIVVELRQHMQYGQPYNGVATLTIQNQTALFSSLKADRFTRTDFKNFEEIAREFGCETAIYERVDDSGKIKEQKVKL